MATKARPAQGETLNFRVKAEDRSLMDRAAQLLGKSRTDFLDQALFAVSPKIFAEFVASQLAARAEREAAPDDDNPGSLEIDGAHGSATDRGEP